MPSKRHGHHCFGCKSFWWCDSYSCHRTNYRAWTWCGKSRCTQTGLRPRDRVVPPEPPTAAENRAFRKSLKNAWR